MTVHLLNVVVREEESRLVFDPESEDAVQNKALIAYDIIADDVAKSNIDEAFVEIRNEAGQLVRTIRNISLASKVEWDGRDNSGNLLPLAKYLFRVILKFNRYRDPETGAGGFIIGGAIPPTAGGATTDLNAASVVSHKYIDL